ncbi:discoidin domain-containing protein [Mucilaginibacter sp. AW1-3]
MMKKLFIALLIVGCFASCKKKQATPDNGGPTTNPPVVAGTILWDGDAPKGNSVWKVATNIEGTGTITTVNDATYGPTWKFDKPLGSHRTESHAANGFQAKEGDEFYIGWRCKITTPPNVATNAVFQWKAYGDNQQQDYPILLSTTSGGNIHLMYYAPGGAGTELWKTKLDINAWNRFVLRLKISSNAANGYIEFWYNGEKQTLAGGSQRFAGRTLDADYCDPKWGVYGGDAQHMINYINQPRIATTYEKAEHEKLNEPVPDPAPPPATVPVDPPSLTINRPITASSQLSGASAANAVDDDLDSYWQPLASDRADFNLWLAADLGTPQPFNAMRVFWSRADFTAKYQLLYSNDNVNWSVAFEKSANITTIEKSSFPEVTARYVKLNITLSESGTNLTTAEWRIFKE